MKAQTSNPKSKKQLMITIVLVILLIGLGAGLLVVRTQLDIRDRAEGPSCTVWLLKCSWNKVDGVTQYRVVVRDPSGNTIANTTTSGTNLNFNGRGGVSYTCTVTALSHENPSCSQLPSGSGTGLCPVDSSISLPPLITDTPTRAPTATTSISRAPTSTPGVGTPTVRPFTPTPTIAAIGGLGGTNTPTPRAGTPTVSSGGITATLTPTPKAGTPTVAPFTPTPTKLAVGGSAGSSTSTPTPTVGSSLSVTVATSTSTTVSSLPKSGWSTPAIAILIIGLLAIVVPLVL